MCAIDFKSVADFFNNQSVGAFLGAFAAYLLVTMNDWRRERRKVKTLRAEIEVNLANAQAKLETARRNRAEMREHNQVRPAPTLRFNTSFTRQLSSEVLHLLSLDQRRAVDALCYTMEAIDEIFSESFNLAQRFTTPLGHAESKQTAEHLLSNLSDCVVNLKRLIEMSSMYLEGKFTEIVTKQYDRTQYEEA